MNKILSTLLFLIAFGTQAATVPLDLGTFNLTNGNSTVSRGDTVVASWSVPSATSCNSSGSVLAGSVSNWSNSLPNANTGLPLTLNTAGVYNFKISCSGPNGATTVVKQVTVVNGPTTPTVPPTTPTLSCDGTGLVPGTRRKTSFVNNNTIRGEGNKDLPFNGVITLTNYSPLWGAAFPSKNGVGGLPLSTNEYAAMAFNTGISTDASTPWRGKDYGGLIWATAQQAGGGEAHVTISPCPGDFTSAFTKVTGCSSGGVGGSINFKIGTGTSRCPLELNKTYYLNIGFFDSEGRDTCGNSFCHFFGQPN